MTNYNTDQIKLHTYKANKSLAYQRGLTDYDIIAIERVGNRLFQFLARPTMYTNPNKAAEIVQGYEHVLQSLWGFSYDSSKHRYQLELNGCTCKHMLDNQPYYGGPFWNDVDCPFHGSDV